MFLTADELRELTGYRRPSKQIEWLRERHWRFELNAAGHPRVARAYLERRMVAREGAGAVESASPDFGAIRA
jgi:hypothetical protein